LGDIAYVAENFLNVFYKLGAKELLVNIEHLHFAAKFEWPHRDPFDRMLAAQASIENMMKIIVYYLTGQGIRGYIKMKKNATLALALSMVLTLAACSAEDSPPPSAEPPQKITPSPSVSLYPSESAPPAEVLEIPHFYATALQEFIENAAGNVNAVLYDLDSCGNEEMIAFDEGAGTRDFHSVYAEGAKITVYDAKNGGHTSSTIEVKYLINSYNAYITNNHYLIISDYWEGDVHQVFIYENGVLAEAARLSYSMMGGEYYGINFTKAGEVEYYDRMNEYGCLPGWQTHDFLEGIAFAIGSKRGGIHETLTLRDKTAEILAMTVI
jgi:hypothetical protein